MTNIVCQGTDIWVNSKLKPNGKPEEGDGRFEIRKKADGTFEGTHVDKDGNTSTLTKVNCGGVGGALNFEREDVKKKKDYTYTGTIQAVAGGGFKIANGSFTRNDKPAPFDGQGQRSDKNKDDDLTDADESGEWTAEKPGF